MRYAGLRPRSGPQAGLAVVLRLFRERSRSHQVGNLPGPKHIISLTGCANGTRFPGDRTGEN